jgi:hypothetical protein
MAKATKRTTKKTPAKKTPAKKSSTRRVTVGGRNNSQAVLLTSAPKKKAASKRTYTRKPKIDAAPAEAPDAGCAIEDAIDISIPEPSIEFDADPFFKSATMGNGFDSDGNLNRIVVGRVETARSNVVYAVREMIDASLQLEKGANQPLQVRRVLEQRQRLSTAEFDLAMDNLERAIRG